MPFKYITSDFKLRFECAFSGCVSPVSALITLTSLSSDFFLWGKVSIWYRSKCSKSTCHFGFLDFLISLRNSEQMNDEKLLVRPLILIYLYLTSILTAFLICSRLSIFLLYLNCPLTPTLSLRRGSCCYIS